MVKIDGDEYLDVEEATRLLGVKRATLYAYVSRGVLSSYRRGMKRRRLYRRADLDRLLRLQPSAARRSGAASRSGRTSQAIDPGDIPLAETWIRE
jgi:citrate synthase